MVLPSNYVSRPLDNDPHAYWCSWPPRSSPSESLSRLAHLSTNSNDIELTSCLVSEERCKDDTSNVSQRSPKLKARRVIAVSAF